VVARREGKVLRFERRGGGGGEKKAAIHGVFGTTRTKKGTSVGNGGIKDFKGENPYSTKKEVRKG